MDPDSPGAIHAKNPNAKIIMILRNPNERLISDYLYQIKYALDILPFEEVVKAGIRSLSKDIHSIVKTGMYSQHIGNYYGKFDKKQIKIIIFEEFIKDTKKTVREVLEFLEIDGLHDFKDEVYNRYAVPGGRLQKAVIKNKTLLKIVVRILPTDRIIKMAEMFLMKKEKRPKSSEFDMSQLREIFLDEKTKLEIMLGRKIDWEI